MSLSVAELKKITGITFNDALTYETVIERIETNTGSALDLAISNALLVRFLIEERSHTPGEVGARLSLSDNQVTAMGRRGKVIYLIGTVNTMRLQWAQMMPFSNKELTDLIERITAEPDADKTAFILEHGSLSKIAVTRLADNATPEEDLVFNAQMDGVKTPQAFKKVLPALAEKLEIKLPVVTRDKSPETAANAKADVATFDQAIATMAAAIEQLHDGTDEKYPLTITSAQKEKLEALISGITDICIRAEIMEPLKKEDRPAEVTEFAADSEEYTRSA